MTSDGPGHEPGKRVVILDRDGTLVIDRGYLSDPAGLEFAPGAVEGIRWFHEHGYRLLVITNQSGVGRGLFPLERVSAMNERLRAMVAEAGATLAGIYFCPHAPQDRCACRKPGQQLMLQAAADLDFDPAAAIVIGDKPSDIEFGRRAGAVTVLIGASSHSSTESLARGAGSPDIVAASLVEAAHAVGSLPPRR